MEFTSREIAETAKRQTKRGTNDGLDLRITERPPDAGADPVREAARVVTVDVTTAIANAHALRGAVIDMFPRNLCILCSSNAWNALRAVVADRHPLTTMTDRGTGHEPARAVATMTTNTVETMTVPAHTMSDEPTTGANDHAAHAG